jgi:ArsR family transcriptional regulator
MKNKIREQVGIFKALAAESRLKIMHLLREHAQCVNVIADRLGMSQPAVSQHLRWLREAGLIKAEKRGIWIHYAIDPETMERHGRVMARIFGGWVKLPEAVDGKRGCPSGLLKDCQAKKTGRKRAKRIRS